MRSEAVIFTGKDQVEYGTVETPEPGPNDVVIVTKYSWISNGTEGSFLKCQRIDGITPWREGMPMPYPMVPGYQKVGIIESVGADVTGFKKGQWVFATVTACKDVQFGVAGHIARGPVNASEVYAVEDENPEAYAGMVLTQVGYNCGSRPSVKDNTRCVVIGDGLVGLWAAQTLQIMGAKVALVGHHDFRMSKFDKSQHDITVNSNDQSWLKKVLDWASGQYQVLIDTVGNRRNSQLNIELLKNFSWGGHFVAAGDPGLNSTIDLTGFIGREITIHLPCAWTRERMELVCQWIKQRKLKTLNLITDRFRATHADKAWEKIFQHKDTTLGVILEWD